jgi:autotransporter passenger strand-loop-strand repeat protein
MATYSVTFGMTSSGITLSRGDFLLVSSGGIAVSTMVSSGGTEIVYSGGTASFTTVSGGGSAVVSGGTAVSTTVDSGGYQYVSSGGSASFTTVTFFGNEYVYSGGATRSTTLVDGGLETVFSGGSTSFTTVSGGLEIVYQGGTAVSTAVSPAGEEDVLGGGQASNTTVNGGYEYLSSGGMAISTTVNSGGIEVVRQSATASLTVVNGSGTQEILFYGTAVSTTVESGGTQVVLGTGAVAIAATVDSGGTQSVTGTAKYTTLSGGIEYVFIGTTTGTIADSGGAEDVQIGALAISTTVNSGGSAVVEGELHVSGGPQSGGGHGGTARDTTVNSGGTEFVHVSAHAISTTLNSGGTEFLYSGNTASDTVVNVGGSIDVSYLPYAGGGSAGVTTSGLLTVSVGGQTYTQQLSGNYADVPFGLAPDTGSGTLITAEAPCYRRGTRILTSRGEIAVEDLHIGDLVQTVVDEGAAPIIWIGRREVDCARHPKPRQVWPVRVTASAFGFGRPHTELFLSPDHAVYVGEVLIPIRHLINGSTIAQVPMDRVTYYHLELPSHDVVLAQGLPAESFLDLKDGSNYANRPGPVRLYPDFTVRMWEAFGCARLIVTGPELAAARALVGEFARAQHVA